MSVLRFPKLQISANRQWCLLAISVITLLVMHYCILFTENENPNYCASVYIENFIGVLADTTIVFSLYRIIFGKRLKTAQTVAFLTILVWSFANVVYFRFFHYYISISSIEQGETIFDCLMIDCIVDSLRWGDCYYIVVLVPLYFCLSQTLRLDNPILRKWKYFAMLAITYVVLMFFYYTHISPTFPYIAPKAFAFRRGSTVSLIMEAYDIFFNGSLQLTKAQKATIENEIRNQKTRIDNSGTGQTYENVVFLIIESYLSYTSDKKIDGKEVTPFLNSLKKDSTVYYNGQMSENVTMGESSDGQFIYMTGLLPLRSSITISKARDAELPGLPKHLSKRTHMIVPTISSMWAQDEMCQQYGFELLYSQSDYAKGEYSYLNDEQVFQLAMQKDKETDNPFFSVVLTMSMHQPYRKQIDSTLLITDLSMPKDLACYLNACHYTDRQVERYFKHLKRSGLYDNSLIVIAADHSVHNTDFGGVSKEIPLYIVNVPNSIRDKMWKGACNQIDVYPTILDLLGIESDWYGLGHSLLSPNYCNAIDSKKWDVSEWIIRGDYFSNQQR